MLPRSREDHLRQRPPRTQNSRPRDRRDPTSLDGGAELFRLAPIHIGLLEIRRSEEHTSELQSRLHLVCRLLLEKKKILSKLRDAAASTCPRDPDVHLSPVFCST